MQFTWWESADTYRNNIIILMVLHTQYNYVHNEKHWSATLSVLIYKKTPMEAELPSTNNCRHGDVATYNALRMLSETLAG